MSLFAYVGTPRAESRTFQFLWTAGTRPLFRLASSVVQRLSHLPDPRSGQGSGGTRVPSPLARRTAPAATPAARGPRAHCGVLLTSLPRSQARRRGPRSLRPAGNADPGARAGALSNSQACGQAPRCGVALGRRTLEQAPGWPRRRQPARRRRGRTSPRARTATGSGSL
jgi:hypothetical protein